MLSNSRKRDLREHIFYHLDGLVVAPSAYTLYQRGILDLILRKKAITLNEIIEEIPANKGYLNVALRVLGSQGWLEYVVDNATATVHINTTPTTEIASKFILLYTKSIGYLKLTEIHGFRKLNKEIIDSLQSVFDEYISFSKPSASTPAHNIEKQIHNHIEGIIIAPLAVILGMGGMFHKYFMEASFKPEEYHKEPELFERALNILTHFEWFDKKNDTYSFTEKGLFFAKRASAYGVTVSYLPTLRSLNELIFGDYKNIRLPYSDGTEKHVDREMNVWGSGGAHAAYFKKIDEIILGIFNKEPINKQPKGILDMGCGNGAFLIHLYNLIEKQTLRGKHLDKHPLLLVGADYNDAALKVTRANMIQADIWAKVIWGDISDPKQLQNNLKENYNISLGELLNVRTFLDHNRIWSPPEIKNPEISSSTGAFVHLGQLIPNNDVEQNLKEHLERWKPYVQKYGLLVIELHTIPPDVTAKNSGKTPATAYDATHGYSDQFIVEIDVFEKAANKAGLFIASNTFARFPDSELATISISLLKGK